MPESPEFPEINSIVEGKVIRIKPFGALVLLPGKFQGLVHISHIADTYVQDIEEFLQTGDVVRVKVISADKESGKIGLSMKGIEQDNFAPRPRFTPKRNEPPATFEEKFKEWVKTSNERHAGINKRNKRR